jgi:hypothetical protein
VIRATGEVVAPDGASKNPAQAGLLVKEGARTMAYARIAECACGVRVAGGTKVQQAVTQDQEVATAVRGVIKGARVVQEDVMTVAGSLLGKVTVELRLQGDHGLGGTLPPRWREDTQKTNGVPQPRHEEQPSPARPPLDGLILDARGLSAYPALYPQVLAEGGRAVYHWDSVAQEHRELVGRVTNTVEKAKTLLRERGATNPMVVKVARMQGPTTYVLSAADGKTVLGADLDGQFLRQSRVVFVLGPE